VRATSAFVRLYIRGLAWDAEDASASFADTLKAAARAKLTSTDKGKVLIGVTSGGTASTYTLPPLGNLSADDVAEVASAVLDACDVIVADDADITDADLKTALLASWPAGGVCTFGRDFRGLANGASVACASEE
jgi:hypothetical protein